jgi:hypothetical protein
LCGLAQTNTTGEDFLSHLLQCISRPATGNLLEGLAQRACLCWVLSDVHELGVINLLLWFAGHNYSFGAAVSVWATWAIQREARKTELGAVGISSARDEGSTLAGLGHVTADTTLPELIQMIHGPPEANSNCSTADIHTKGPRRVFCWLDHQNAQ